MAYCRICKGEHVKGHKASGEVVWNPSTNRYERSTGRYVTVGGGHHYKVTPRVHLTDAQKRQLGICLHDGCKNMAPGRADYCEAHQR